MTHRRLLARPDINPGSDDQTHDSMAFWLSQRIVVAFSRGGPVRSRESGSGPARLPRHRVVRQSLYCAAAKGAADHADL